MNGLSHKWLELLLNLCTSAEIAAGNKDLTKRERDHLCSLASEVKAEVIAQINKRRVR
jgi:hypothetical protein